MKKLICAFSIIMFISCNNDKKNQFEGSWCISNIEVNFNEKSIDSLNVKEIIALSLFDENIKPTNIIISKNEIKLLIKNEVLSKSNYIIENYSDNAYSILIDNKFKGTISKQKDVFTLNVDKSKYYFKKCE